MKKNIIVFLTLTLMVSIVLLAYAGHDPVLIPYETQALGESTRMPMAAGGDLRQHIIGQEPYKTWSLWPGKGKMYEGTEPHGAFITVYVNDIALKSINEKKAFANNSIVMKENFSEDKKLSAITVMYKVKGYNPSQGDWFWAKYDADFNILSEGKVKGCLDCHSDAQSNDYIFTGKAK